MWTNAKIWFCPRFVRVNFFVHRKTRSIMKAKEIKKYTYSRRDRNVVAAKVEKALKEFEKILSEIKEMAKQIQEELLKIDMKKVLKIMK